MLAIWAYVPLASAGKLEVHSRDLKDEDVATGSVENDIRGDGYSRSEFVDTWSESQTSDLSRALVGEVGRSTRRAVVSGEHIVDSGGQLTGSRRSIIHCVDGARYLGRFRCGSVVPSKSHPQYLPLLSRTSAKPVIALEAAGLSPTLPTMYELGTLVMADSARTA